MVLSAVRTTSGRRSRRLRPGARARRPRPTGAAFSSSWSLRVALAGALPSRRAGRRRVRVGAADTGARTSSASPAGVTWPLGLSSASAASSCTGATAGVVPDRERPRPPRRRRRRGADSGLLAVSLPSLGSASAGWTEDWGSSDCGGEAAFLVREPRDLRLRAPVRAGVACSGVPSARGSSASSPTGGPAGDSPSEASAVGRACPAGLAAGRERLRRRRRRGGAVRGVPGASPAAGVGSRRACRAQSSACS